MSSTNAQSRWMDNTRFRTALAFGHDLFAAAVAWIAAHWLRFNLDIPFGLLDSFWLTLAWVVPLQGFVFWQMGLYRGIWRYASLPDLKRILVAVGIAALATPAILVLFGVKAIVPRSVLLLDPILLLIMMGGSRAAYRVWKEHRLYGSMWGQGEPVLVLGTGEAAVSLVKELSRSKDWRVVGLLDDDAGKQGLLFYGIKVLGGLADLPALVGPLRVSQAIIADPSAPHTWRRKAVDVCAKAGVGVLTVPSFDDLMSGRVTVSAIRKVELDDLLGRDPVRLDDAGLHGLLGGRVVMVTGAGGSIGSELCRQIAKFGPAQLILYELNEFALYRIEQEFASALPSIPVVCAMGDVKDRTRLDEILGRYRPAVVFHAAAYKHVPLMEEENAWQAVRNNVLGTCTLARAAVAHGVQRFVLVSTDKAVNPANVMGASKRLAEMACQAAQAPSAAAAGGGAAETRFVIVRFGNVLGSAGSVVPKFQEQIARGGPVTVTHAEITRYFMSIPEAAQLVLQAALMGKGGEIFVMDMGEPVRIADLARDMIRLSGLNENEIRIVYTGLRPGEKLYEELLADDEHSVRTPHPKLRIARAAEAPDAEWLQGLEAWLRMGALDEQAVKWRLASLVPEYRPARAGESKAEERAPLRTVWPLQAEARADAPEVRAEEKRQTR